MRGPVAVRLVGLTCAGAALGLVALRLRRRRKRRKVVITGGSGNLGTKLARHLCEDGSFDVVLLEHPGFVRHDRAPKGARIVVCDVAVHGEWVQHLRGAYAVVHFSARRLLGHWKTFEKESYFCSRDVLKKRWPYHRRSSTRRRVGPSHSRKKRLGEEFHYEAVNPYPNADWLESAESMSHAFNVLTNASRLGARRVVLASSNHVMGGYKDKPHHEKIRPDDPPHCGTLLLDDAARAKSGDAIAYAAAKLAAERLAHALAPTTKTEFLTLRIGWCQPGENSPATLSAAGVPPEYQTATEAALARVDVDENWFKHMWLSNADFIAYFNAALHVALPEPDRHFLVNAMSRNSGARWCLDATERLLRVQPRDDSMAHTTAPTRGAL